MESLTAKTPDREALIDFLGFCLRVSLGGQLLEVDRGGGPHESSQALNLNACTSQSPKKVNTSSQSNVRTLQSQEHHQQMQSTNTLQG